MKFNHKVAFIWAVFMGGLALGMAASFADHKDWKHAIPFLLLSILCIPAAITNFKAWQGQEKP